MEEAGGLQSMGSLRVGHDWATSLSLFTFIHWRRKWQPTPMFLPWESQGRGSLVAAVYGVTQSQTRLKWLSSRSSSSSSSRGTELNAFLYYVPHVIAFIHDTDISSNIPAGGSTTHQEPSKQKLLKFTWSYWLLSGKQTFLKNETNVIFKIITVNKCQSLTLDKFSMFWIKQMIV